MPAVPTIDRQAEYWDRWNIAARTDRVPDASLRQAERVEAAIAGMGRPNPAILDVGCGTGWLSGRLARLGEVTGTDMTASVIERAREHYPSVDFLCGDFFELPLPASGYDVVTSLEVLSHVAEQPAFICRIAELLRPQGLLVLSTQNRPVYERWSAVAPPDPAQIRQWVDRQQLRRLLQPHFAQVQITSVCPVGDRSHLRLLNSPKLNRLLGAVLGGARVERWKESAMLGGTLIAVARKG